MLKTGARIIKDVLLGRRTPKQIWYQIQMRFFNSQAELNDDFDWTKYNLHYREELKSMALAHTVIAKSGDFCFRDGRIVQLNAGVKPLHSNHHLLYEIILGLNPSSILEVGCGGGDHLRNLKFFAPTLRITGVDRSAGQLDTLRSRHPHLEAGLAVVDMTVADLSLAEVDLVYTQAVLMHISENNNRYMNALKNVFRTAKSQVVLMENWTQHNFLSDITEVMKIEKSGWSGADIYYAYRDSDPKARIMIVSKKKLNYPSIASYEDLLQGQSMNLNR